MVDLRNSTFDSLVIVLCAIEASASASRKGGAFLGALLSSWPGLTRLDPAIHAPWLSLKKDVDARDKREHDGRAIMRSESNLSWTP
jgi:hypothetical protein